MFNTKKFISILKRNFKDTKFMQKYDKNLDLYQILHDNYELEIDNNLENKIMELLGKYYYNEGVVNIMISYDFYNEIRVIEYEIDGFSFSFNEKSNDFDVYKPYNYLYKKTNDIEVETHNQRYSIRENQQQNFYKIGKAS
ncbi:MAG: hypothetical protein U9N34_01445 [Candidatus Cloacimonadota bacterium]|nr:hypothetical protein [Candidatus Cloacimonadota bacterium]